MVRFVGFILHRLSVGSSVNVFCAFIIYEILVLSLDNKKIIVQEAAFGVRAQLNCLRMNLRSVTTACAVVGATGFPQLLEDVIVFQLVQVACLDFYSEVLEEKGTKQFNVLCFSPRPDT